MVIDFFLTNGRIPIACEGQRLMKKFVIPLNWRQMERMVFLQPFLDKNSRSIIQMDVDRNTDKCEAIEECPKQILVDSVTRERNMKATIRNALKNYKYSVLLKVLQRFRLKYYRKQDLTIKCEVIDSVEAELEQCTPIERKKFIRWYSALLKRRIDAAVINESLNYRVY